jgi:hypothetical protein
MLNRSFYPSAQNGERWIAPQNLIISRNRGASAKICVTIREKWIRLLVSATASRVTITRHGKYSWLALLSRLVKTGGQATIEPQETVCVNGSDNDTASIAVEVLVKDVGT